MRSGPISKREWKRRDEPRLSGLPKADRLFQQAFLPKPLPMMAFGNCRMATPFTLCPAGEYHDGHVARRGS